MSKDRRLLMRSDLPEQLGFSAWLEMPEVAPPKGFRPHDDDTASKPLGAAEDDGPLIGLSLPDQAAPDASRALWRLRAVQIGAWRERDGLTLRDCAFAFGVTLKALFRLCGDAGVPLKPDPDLRIIKPCKLCGGLMVTASPKFVTRCDRGCEGAGVEYVAAQHRHLPRQGC